MEIENVIDWEAKREQQSGSSTRPNHCSNKFNHLPESYADYITPKEIEYLNDNRYMLKVREYLDSH